MNKKFSQERIMLYYYENKEYLIPVLAIAVSLFLFFIFLLPQILSFPSRKQAIEVENEVLKKIQNTEKIVLSENSDELDSKIKIVSSALPPGKNFEQILNGISTAAVLSGTQIQNYQFQNIETEAIDASKYPNLEFKVTIIGDPREAVDFIKELYKTFPISDVTNISSQKSLTSITVNFFYKPFPPVEGEDRITLKSLTAEQSKILNEVLQWNRDELGSIINIDLEASSSGETRTSPF